MTSFRTQITKTATIITTILSFQLLGMPCSQASFISPCISESCVRYASLGFSPTITRFAEEIDRIAIATKIGLPSYPYERMIQAAESNWGPLSQMNSNDPNLANIERTIKAAMERMDMLKAVREKTARSKNHHSLLIVLGAHPPYLCEMLDYLKHTKHIKNALIAGSSKLYSRALFSKCKNFTTAHPAYLENLPTLSQERDIMWAYIKGLGVSQIHKALFDNPEQAVEAERNLSSFNNNSLLKAFLKNNPYYLIHYQSIVLVAPQPFASEALLIVKSHAPSSQVYKLFPETSFNIEESLEALLELLKTDHAFNSGQQ